MLCIITCFYCNDTTICARSRDPESPRAHLPPARPPTCAAPTATVTNDIFTREDQEFLIKNKALPAARILAIETGGCPHAAIREDISANMGALEALQAKYACQLLFVESGGDNLAANYSRELADYIIYVIDVSVRFLVVGVCGAR